MLEDEVLGVQQTFGRLDIDVNVDPVLSGALVKFANAIGEESFMDEI